MLNSAGNELKPEKCTLKSTKLSEETKGKNSWHCISKADSSASVRYASKESRKDERGLHPIVKNKKIDYA